MLLATLVLGAGPALAPIRAREERACATVRLADVEATDGVRSGELVVVARSDGTLIAWAEGGGARL
ncbi:MAG TPA: hypothetical protein VM509_13870, partial [Planctomycetota bacterium]|nr:hypothetical protein [Planctomycetota bacterium]